ncbi:MAG: glycosyltransferase [Chloroflexi bacterium]|jgi:glycosyltransferase involved in cell wall biosynthesis|nr:glycosyltransferase [Chloroflexota bacterium]
MHILIATPAFPPFIGGGERHTGTLARHLVDRGHAVTILTSTALKEPDLWRGCGQDVKVETVGSNLKIVRTPIRKMPGGIRGLLAWRKSMVMLSALPGTIAVLQTMAKRVPPLVKLDQALTYINRTVDVVHGFNISWEHAMMAGWKYARQNGLPFIASPLAHLGAGPRDRVALNSTMRHQRHMLSTADLLLTNTSIEARGLQERGVDHVEFKVAGPGVDIPETIVTMPKAGAILSPYVIFVGRTSYDKGAIHAAQAVLHLRNQGSNIRLVLIGRETDEFHRFYDDLPASDQQALHVLGYVEESLKHAYLKEAEALLLPSRSDSFGIVLLESWLYSRPVIAAASGGIPDVVDDGKNGILVPFGDISSLSSAIKLLSENQELSRALGENGYQKLVARYTWAAVTDIVVDAYREVVDVHGPEMKTS